VTTLTDSSSDSPSKFPLVAIAVAVFAVSGCSGLIYQSIWSHYLGLYLGHSAYAQCLVLTIFMGGLAIGSWFASRRGQQWRNLLLRYALVEAAIGVFGLVFHPVFVASTSFAYDTLLPAMPNDGLVSLAKWVSGALLILPQSVLLGMTFPLMANGVIRRMDAGPGAIISVLYFSNSFGAAAGALIATFVLLPSMGLPGAMQAAGVLNLVVALVAWALSRRADPGHVGTSLRAPRLHEETAGTTPARLLLAAAFITGATSFVYEIVWVRMLSLSLGTTLHSFELMLTAFIGGLALGGWVLRRRIDALPNLICAAAYVQIAMGLAALATLMLYGKSFEWTAFLMHSLARNASGYVWFNLATAGIALVIMMPAAFFAGMTLPMFSLALARAGAGEAAIGRIYAANTFGAILGVIAAVLLLIPGLGLKLAMTLAALGDIALGLVLFRRSAGEHDRGYAVALAVSGLFAIAFTQLAPFDQRTLASGVYRTGSARIPDDAHLLFYRDGATATVDVGERNGIRLVATNGKSDSAIQMRDSEPPTEDENTTTLLAVLPLAANPQARSAAVIGIGTGMTTNTLLGSPALQTVDTIEIEPAMVAAAHAFGKYSERAFLDTRSHIHIEDARVFFSARRARYDIVVSEPSNPWVTGVASLFTDEFYAHVARHLAPRGVFVQWVQLYEIDNALVATIANALADHFRDYRLYLSNNEDLLIVASADAELAPADPNIFANPAIAASLAHIGIRSLNDLSVHELGSKRDLAPYFQALSTLKNSDYYPVLSLEAPRARFANSSATAVQRLLESDLPLVEMTQHRPAPAADAAVSIDPNFARTFEIAAAHELLARYRDEPPATALLDGQTLSTLAALREYQRTCGKSADAHIAIGWMYQIGAAMIPNLNPSELEPLWRHDALHACKDAPSLAIEFENVLAALAARDAKDISERAQNLLTEHAADLTPELADYLLRAAMLAQRVTGESERDLTITPTFQGKISSPEVRVEERIYLQTTVGSHLRRP